MESIGFAQYVDAFKENDMDGEALLITPRDDFKYVIPSLGNRSKILKARDGLFGDCD